MLVDVTLFAYFGISDDAACHCSGNLTCQNLHTFRGFDDYCRALVFCAGFGQPGFHEFTIVVGYLFHCPVYRIPIGMYVQDAHKDRYHNTTVVKIFVFVHFLDNYNLAISGCYDYLFRFFSEKTLRTTEEVNHQSVNDDTGQNHQIKRQFTFYSIVKGDIDK